MNMFFAYLFRFGKEVCEEHFVFSRELDNQNHIGSSEQTQVFQGWELYPAALWLLTPRKLWLELQEAIISIA